MPTETYIECPSCLTVEALTDFTETNSCPSCGRAKPTRQDIIDRIECGRRDAVEDADEIETPDYDGEAHFIHYATDGSITLKYVRNSSYESTISGGVYEFTLDGGLKTVGRDR